jgi:hypothetical protein
MILFYENWKRRGNYLKNHLDLRQNPMKTITSTEARQSSRSVISAVEDEPVAIQNKIKMLLSLSLQLGTRSLKS